MGSDIGDMFYSTGNGPDGFTLVPTSDPNNSVREGGVISPTG